MLCIVAFVYGPEYQGWIPIYLYSIIHNYPKYHARIYIDYQLRKDVKHKIEQLDSSRFEIIENVLDQYGHFKSDIEKRALRWLMFDPELLKYKYVYVGDIDIYITKESVELLQQHIEHLSKTNLCYSNAVRLTLKDFIFANKCKNITNLNKLTGLHFFQADKYLPKVKETQKEFLRCMMGQKQSFLKEFLFTWIFSDDERILYYLVKRSGLKFPKGSLFLQSPHCFRPPHGIHFGIGREFTIYNIFAPKEKLPKLMEYFNYFVSDCNNSILLRKFICSDPYIKKVTANTCLFFHAKLNESGVIQICDPKK